MLLSPSSSSRASHTWTLDDGSASDAFPLTPPPVPVRPSPCPVSLAERDAYRCLVQRRVQTLLADEAQMAARRAQEHPSLPPRDWKVFRHMRDLTVYRRRTRGRTRQDVARDEEFPEAALAVERGHPSMMVHGDMHGTIEDMLYGVSGTTQDELRTGFSMTVPTQQVALLSVVEGASPEAPLHSVALVWLLMKLPLMHPRDVCFLKATGVAQDDRGDTYGYLVLHSVDLEACPPFDYRATRILRAKLFFAFVFRATGPGQINVLGRGVFDLAGGEMLKLVLPHATAILMEGLLAGVSCGQAKKLTVLARRYQQERTQVQQGAQMKDCARCLRGPRVLANLRLRSCDICGYPICYTCKMKEKRVFTGTKHPWREVTCCTVCAQQATKMQGVVLLGAPEYVVVAEMYANAATSSGHKLKDVATELGEGMTPCETADEVDRDSERDAGVFVKVALPNNDLHDEPFVAKDASMLYERSQLPAVEVSMPAMMKETPYSTHRPNNMLEWMLQLQSSAEEAYIATKANGEIMKKAMR
ncbi:hypothetical protein PsorP6_006672 [Peronosclerospora sorghi]|uniref:Uncharacterized protein n=1 Tax=Peronosclerospora sorghi TaxID=230839 RepID=A0ACC0W3I7_9STRA|nr:hypothetical protein PsorP6_006672 [Peronosclerospora sorghi]